MQSVKLLEPSFWSSSLARSSRKPSLGLVSCRGMGRIWSLAWFGGLDCRWGGRLDMRSTPRVTLDPASPTPSCRSPARAHPTGDTHWCRLSAPCLAAGPLDLPSRCLKSDRATKKGEAGRHRAWSLLHHTSSSEFSSE